MERDFGKIEKGIPAPAEAKRHLSWEVLDRMEAGDSVLVRVRDPQVVYLAIAYRKMRYGKAFATRKAAAGSYRVWRVR